MATRKKATIKTVIAEAAEISVREGMRTKITTAVNAPLAAALRFEGTASSTPTPPRKRKPAPANGPQDRALLANMRERFAGFVEIGVPLFHTGRATGDPVSLWDLFLSNLSPKLRATYNCNTCRRFVEAFGDLALIDPETGIAHSALWVESRSTPAFNDALTAMRDEISRRTVSDVFLVDRDIDALGTSTTGVWHHFALEVPHTAAFRVRGVTTDAHQQMAAKRQDFELLRDAVRSYRLSLAESAQRILDIDGLYRSEKIQAPLKWFIGVHEEIRPLARAPLTQFANRLWLAAATAPAGFCHVKSSVLGTLLDDIRSGEYTTAEVRARFAAKMNPLQYQRPTADVTPGNVRRAEHLIDTLGLRPALERRYAILSDLKHLEVWRHSPTAPLYSGIGPVGQGERLEAEARRVAQQSPTFAPLLNGLADRLQTERRYRENAARSRGFGSANRTLVRGSSSDPNTAVGYWRENATLITWARFEETVLPHTGHLYYLVPAGPNPLIAFTAPVVPNAEPILRWDSRELRPRNAVGWFCYAEQLNRVPWRWGLTSNRFRRVDAVVQFPDDYRNCLRLTSTGAAVPVNGEPRALILADCRDTQTCGSSALFPETLRGELHDVRSTIEAHSNATPLKRLMGLKGEEAAGIDLRPIGGDNTTAYGGESHVLVVILRDGVTMKSYRLTSLR